MKTKNDHLPLYGVGPIYGGVVAVLTIAGVFVGRLPALSGGKLTTFRIPLLVLGIALIALGIFIWVQSVFVSKIDDGIKENRLVTSGIYAWVRNPIYSAILIVCTGVLLIVGNAWLFLLPPLYWLFLTVLMKHTEERWLRDLYGADYESYCKQVNRCIPWFPKGV